MHVEAWTSGKKKKVTALLLLLKCLEPGVQMAWDFVKHGPEFFLY